MCSEGGAQSRCRGRERLISWGLGLIFEGPAEKRSGDTWKSVEERVCNGK